MVNHLLMLFKSNMLHVSGGGKKQRLGKHGPSQTSFGDSRLCSFISSSLGSILWQNQQLRRPNISPAPVQILHFGEANEVAEVTGSQA